MQASTLGRTISVVLRFGLLVGLIGAVSAANADALADIKARGKLTVGVEAGGTGAILSSDSSGKIIGQDADLSAIVAKGLGVQLEMVETPWPGTIPALLSSRFDMIMSGMTATKARAKTIASIVWRSRCEGVVPFTVELGGLDEPGQTGQLLDPLRRRLVGRRHACLQPAKIS
jgi:hypothetical protein